MKAEHILLLVLAGAAGGAGIMKLIRKPQPVAVAQVKAETIAPVAPPIAPVMPAPPESVPAKSPAPVTRPHPRVERTRQRVTPRVQVFAIKPSPFAPLPVAPPQASPPAAPFMAPARVDPDPVPVTPAPPPPPPTVTLNAGMLIPVRLVDGLSSERNALGDAFAATLDRELVADGFVIAERGARAEGRIVAIGTALSIELTRLYTSDGQQVAIHTDIFEKHAELKLPSATRVSFRLSAPFTLTERR